VSELLAATAWPQVDISEKQEEIPGEVVVPLCFAVEKQTEPVLCWTISTCVPPKVACWGTLGQIAAIA